MAKDTGLKSAFGGAKSASGGAIDLSVSFCGVKFPNPFLLSSSPVSNSAEMVEMAFEQGWGGVCYKTLNSDRIPIIHPSPRMNAYHYEAKQLVGLQNVEQISDRPLKDNLADFLYLKKKYPSHPIIASIMGFSNHEWAYLAKAAADNGADMLELNFSCPHMTVEGSGHKVGQAVHLLEKFTATVKHAVSIPVLAKMTPNITDMTEPALFAKKGGADGISAVNTFRAISEIGLGDWVAKPNVFGVGAMSGYSGSAIKPIALHFIAEMAQCAELGLPLSAMGGIETWIDALEYLLVGATTVQVTTGIIKYGYRIVADMIEGLSDYMSARGITRAEDLIGKALPNLKSTDHFDLERQGVAAYDMDRCVGCGQCYIVCRDAGGQALEWDEASRRPKLVEDKCLSCMICSFICPVPGLITHKEMPKGWARRPTGIMDKAMERQVKIPNMPLT
jgi:dihydropyrimidine dehydrogenase (NAD+) subunit PreA